MNVHEGLEEYWEEKFDKGVEFYYRAIKGENNAAKEAHTLFSELITEQPNHTELMAYLGAVKALLARDTFDLREKGKYANEGLKYLDVAVLKNPSNAVIRMLRGNVSLHLPENRFRRTETAIEDFECLISMYDTNPQAIPESLCNETMKGLIQAYERLNKTDEAIRIAHKISELDSSFVIPKFSKNNTSDRPAFDSIDDPIDDKVQYLYSKAVQGDEISLLKVHKLLSNLLKSDPTNPILQAFHTHSESMRNSDCSKGMVELFTTAYKTAQALDKLVSEFPHAYKIRYARAMQSYRLPEFFFFRSSTAARDFQFLLNEYEKDNAIFSNDLRENIMLKLGESFTRLDMKEEALHVWDKLIEVSSNKEMVQKAKKLKEVFTFNGVDISDIKEEDLYETGKNLHNLGVMGSKTAAKQSLEIWRLITKKHSSCPKAKFYYSASLTLQGLFCQDPYELFGKTIKGLKKLNSSLPMNDPTYISLLLNRAYILFPLPEAFFHCNDNIIKDFEAIIKLYKDRSGQVDLSRGQYLKVLADLGTIYERKHFLHKAKKIWSELAMEDTDTVYGEFLASKGV